MTKTTMAPTWRALVAAEPRLAELLREIQTIRDDKTKPGFCANARWFGYRSHDPGFREQMKWLVGFNAFSAPDELRTSAAHDVVYKKLYAALPDCRNCSGCTRF